MHITVAGASTWLLLLLGPSLAMGEDRPWSLEASGQPGVAPPPLAVLSTGNSSFVSAAPGGELTYFSVRALAPDQMEVVEDIATGAITAGCVLSDDGAVAAFTSQYESGPSYVRRFDNTTHSFLGDPYVFDGLATFAHAGSAMSACVRVGKQGAGHPPRKLEFFVVRPGTDGIAVQLLWAEDEYTLLKALATNAAGTAVAALSTPARADGRTIKEKLVVLSEAGVEQYKTVPLAGECAVAISADGQVLAIGTNPGDRARIDVYRRGSRCELLYGRAVSGCLAGLPAVLVCDLAVANEGMAAAWTMTTGGRFGLLLVRQGSDCKPLKAPDTEIANMGVRFVDQERLLVTSMQRFTGRVNAYVAPMQK